MNVRTFITGGRVITGNKEIDTTVIINNGKIENADFRGDIPSDAKVISADGMYVAPGIVDVHMHGGGGYDFMDATEEAFEKILSRIHPGAIILLHNTSSTNAEILDELLMKLKELGYGFGTLEQFS